MKKNPVSIGDRLIDTNESEISPVIVYDLPEEKAGEYIVTSLGKTVKDLNTGCDENEDVINVVFESKLRDKIPNWAFLDASTLKEKIKSSNIKSYAYPNSRLTHVNNGLVNGVTIRVSGVAEPLNQNSGAYTYTIENNEKEIYSNAEIVNSDTYNLQKPSVIYLGLIDALQWIKRNDKYEGVLIRTENKISVNQLNNEYDVRNEFDNMLYEMTNSYLVELDYWNANLEPRYKQYDLIETAKDTFRTKEEIKQTIKASYQ